MGWKKFLLGEKMPDKDDPKYRKQYETEVASGRRFAEKLHLDRPFMAAQRFANKYPAAFLSLVFGFVLICLCMNIYRMVSVYHARPHAERVTATQRQEQRLQQLKDSVIINTLNSDGNVSE